MIAEAELNIAISDNARPRAANARASHFTIETALYTLFVVLAVLTRFWDLGAKALHHDESLHAYYSWVYETGGGYRHDPLMHGPLLFHLNALVYLLVGASNASSRYAPALTGVLVVWLPYLLRGPKHLGRWGALSASFLFLISPTILYQSRYIRHDIYTVAGSLVITIAIFRYLERPQRRWLILGAAAIAASLANHEIIFAVLALFAGFLYVWLLGSRLASWRETKRNTVYQIVLLHLGSAIALMALFIAVPKRFKDELINIPWENPTNHQQMVYYRHVVTNPLILGAIVIIAAFIVGLRALLNRARDEERRAKAGCPRFSTMRARAASKPASGRSGAIATVSRRRSRSARLSSSRSSPVCSSISTVWSRPPSPPTAPCSTGSASTTCAEASNPGFISPRSPRSTNSLPCFSEPRWRR